MIIKDFGDLPETPNQIRFHLSLFQEWLLLPIFGGASILVSAFLMFSTIRPSSIEKAAAGAVLVFFLTMTVVFLRKIFKLSKNRMPLLLMDTTGLFIKVRNPHYYSDLGFDSKFLHFSWESIRKIHPVRFGSRVASADQDQLIFELEEKYFQQVEAVIDLERKQMIDCKLTPDWVHLENATEVFLKKQYSISISCNLVSPLSPHKPRLVAQRLRKDLIAEKFIHRPSFEEIQNYKRYWNLPVI